MNVLGQSPSFPYGCCDFQFETNDQSIICGRSMEFPIQVDSQIHVHTRGEKRSSMAPDKSTGLEWVSKYGYIGVNALKLDDPCEGLNEKGLSFGFLSLQGTKYQEVSKDQMKQALGIIDAGAWILGNFETVDEVKEALQVVRIWGDFIDPIEKKVMGLHIALHDATGKNIVIEFIDGEAVVHDNPIGVLTNEPNFPFHMENLRQYNYLNPETAKTITINGEKVPTFNRSGSKMIGLPGDWSSISRFIRTATVIRFAEKVESALEGVNLAEHILNVVDRTKGTTIVKMKDTTLYETTRWTTIKDLTHKILYYRSYDDLALRAINLGKLDFSEGKKYKVIPVNTGKQTVIDMTNKLFE